MKYVITASSPTDAKLQVFEGDHVVFERAVTISHLRAQVHTAEQAMSDIASFVAAAKAAVRRMVAMG